MASDRVRVCDGRHREHWLGKPRHAALCVSRCMSLELPSWLWAVVVSFFVLGQSRGEDNC